MVNSNSDQPLTGSEADQHLKGDHIALIYETDEERLSAVTPLIRVGLEKGEICLYISSEENDTDMLEALKAENIDVDKAVGSGGLILTHKKEMYFKRGNFDPDWTMKVISNVAELAKSYGFTAMRIISDMTWTQEKVAGVERWPEYEAKLNTFNPGISLRIICQYDRRVFSPPALIIALHAHPRVVTEGSINNNLFYVPTDRLLKDDYSALELERMLDSIRLYNSAESDLMNRDRTIEDMRRRVSEENAARREAEEELDHQQSRFNDLAERASDWSWEIDENGNYTWSSARVRDILGILPEDVIGRSPQDLITPESAEHISNILTKTMGAHVPITALEKQAVHKDGHTVYLEMNGMPHFGRDGKFMGYRGIDRDITGRMTAKQAIEESHKRVEESVAKVQERDHRIEALEVAITQLKSQQAERDATTQFIKESLRSSQAELTKTEENLGRLRDALQMREEELAAAKAAAEAKQAEQEEQKAGLTLIQQNLEDKDAELVTSQSALAEVQKALQEKDAEMVTLTASYKSQSLELNGAKESLSGVEEAIGRKAEELITMHQQVEKLNADLQKSKESLASKEEELKHVMDQHLKAAEDLDLRTKELAEASSELESKGTGLTEALAAAKVLRSDLASREDEVERLSEEMERKQDELECSTEHGLNLQEELDSKTSLMAELSAQLEAAKAEVTTRSEEFQASKEANLRLENENSQMSWAREQLDDLARVKDREIEELRAQMGRAGEELRYTEDQLSAARSEADVLKGRCQELQGRADQLSTDQNVNETIILGIRDAMAQREVWLAASREEAGRSSSQAAAAHAEKNTFAQDLDRTSGQLYATGRELEAAKADLTVERDQHQLSKEELELRLRELEEVRELHRHVTSDLVSTSQAFAQEKEKLESVERERDEKIASLNTTTEQLESTKNELSQLKEELERTAQELAQEKEKLVAAEGERDEKVQVLSSTSQELESTKNELSQLREEQQRTAQELQQKAAELEALNESMTSTKQELDRLTERHTAAQQDIEGKSGELSTLNVEAERLRSELSMSMDNHQTSLGDLEKRAAEMIALTATLKGVRSELASEKEDRTRTSDNLDIKIRELEALAAEMEGVRAQLTGLQEQHQTSIGELERKGVDLASTSATLESTQTELSQLQEQHQHTAAELQTKNEELERRLKELEDVREQHRHVTGDLESTSQAFAQEKEKLESVERERDEKAQTLITTAQELEGTKTELLQLQELQQRTSEELAQEKEKLVAAEGERDEKVQALSSTVQDLEGTRAELSALQEQHTASTISLDQANQDLLAVRADLGTKDVALAEALTTIEALKGTLTTKVMELNDRTVELEARQQAALRANEELSRLQEELSAKAASIEAARLASVREASRLQSIIDNMRTGVAVISPEGKITKSNPALRNLLGSPDLEGRPASDVLPNLDLGRADFRSCVAEGVEFDVRASSVVDPEGGKGTVLTFSPRTAVLKPQPVEERPEPEPCLPAPIDDPLTAILGNVSLAKEYVIPEGRMYGMLRQIESATHLARNKLMGLNDEPTESLVKGKGRVLLLDDDESVLEATNDVLQYLGYVVEIARDEEEAVILSKQAADTNEPFDMVIMDYVTTSGTPPQQVVQRLREQIPHIRAIATGPVGSMPSTAELEKQGFSTGVLKPFPADQMSRVMAEVMGRK